MSRIYAFHIKGGISFRITQGLRLGQYIGKVTAFVAHFRKDKITRAIDNARQPLNFIGRQTFAHGFDNGNTTGNGRFISHNHTLFLCCPENLRTVYRNQCLVGRNHMLAVFNGLHHHVFGKGIATDQLHHNIHIRIGHHRIAIFTQGDLGGVENGLGIYA